jgi:RNA polymerase sigma-70 factor (ECF subfamily)
VQSHEERGATALPWKADLGYSVPSARHSLWEEFSVVYERCFPTVLWYILSRVDDPGLAEDLVGETFERALRAWPTFRREASACSWILGIARHVIAAHWKRAGRQPLRLEDVSDDARAADSPTPEEHLERLDDLEQLRSAMARLTAQERDLILLRFAVGLPFKEIAASLSTREGTVRVRIHRALRRLRSLLDMEE